VILPSVLHRRLDEQWSSPADRARLARRFEQSIDALQRIGDRRPAGAWWVPGRLEVFGKHTDYAGGRSLIAAVPRGFAFVGAARDDGRVRVIDAASGETGPPTGWGRYVDVVWRRLTRNFPSVAIGADIAFMSDLPRAAGLSSSSALMVGTAVALATLNHLDAHPAWREALGSDLALANYLSCVENGSTHGTLEGDAGVGTMGGSEDHTAILCGRPERLSAYAFVPVRRLEDVVMPAPWTFVIAASGVPAEKTGDAQALYNRAAFAAKRLLDIWNAANPAQPSLAAALGTDPAAEAQLRELADRSRHREWPATDLQRRLTHFVNEDRRVPAAVDAFRRVDVEALTALAAASQEDADRLLRNQIAETNALARLARDHGAWASCAFGAGFGGSVWALVPRDDAERIANRWLADYRARFPTRAADWFIARPSPPLLDLLSERAPQALSD
jgi:galactokinase